MAWLSVGSAIATNRGEWVRVGDLQSNILRLRYTFAGNAPSRVIYGALRERFAANLYNSRWYTLYPKVGGAEVLVLEPIPAFQGTIYATRGIEVKQRGNAPDWQIQIDQWL
ncbi:MAG: hypothetical protein F6K00_27115 [Leptolyngbya sp. SIOISBB]|nr:hypothetical protein [Leptolyngbya sp. SIOISBB]